MSKNRVIVLVSGGLDSAVVLYWAKDRKFSVTAMGFDYFRRSEREKRAARSLCRAARCKLINYKLNFLRELDDNRKAVKNPLLKSAPSAYIPARNVIVYGLASYLAELSDAQMIVGGHNRNDAKLFRDASKRFFEIFNVLLKSGLYSGGRTSRIAMPLATLSKSEVIKLGARLRVPFELTWSCQRNGERPCGRCRSCVLRRDSFRKAGLKDPLVSLRS